jgi:hypothetical protein
LIMMSWICLRQRRKKEQTKGVNPGSKAEKAKRSMPIWGFGTGLALSH